MLDIKHIATNNLYNPKGRMERFLKMKGLLDQKCAANLRLLATKNNINRASDYHYLNLAVTQSTEPINGLDYIHPVVKPMVDYSTAVISKGLAQNGEINFEFIPDNEADSEAAKQATLMVHKIINQQNDPHKILQHWIMDALLHKNGEMLVSPYEEDITRYVEFEANIDQMRAFEAQAADSKLTATLSKKRKIRIDMEKVMLETQQMAGDAEQQDFASMVETRVEQYRRAGEEEDDMALDEDIGSMVDTQLSNGEQMLNESIARNTIYACKYKLVGKTLNVRFRPISQHYWMCNPTIINIQDQDFCGFYDPMTIQEATERYPNIDLDLFMEHAEFSNVGAYQSGSLLNNLAIHARDSVPINGLPNSGYAAQEPEARQVTILTVWNRYDIDGDGELELVEVIYSGSYIISAKEVEFIPVANMCPRPLPQNFYGMSLAESLVPAQEYATAGHRAEIQLGLLTATPRLGVKPDKVDFEQLQDGEAAIFILDSKFDPATDIYPVPPPSGNLQFIDVALNRIQQDVMGMVGMTTPQDVFNPEVMSAGNSGAKLQLALGPNQLIQDNTVKNCATALKDAIWLVWRTLIQYGNDNHGVVKLAQMFNPNKEPVFLDAKNFENMMFCDRKIIHIDLAVGMSSDENSIQRQQIIVQSQTQLYQAVQQMAMSGTLTPEVFKKIKKPYEDTLYVLGVKDADAYLPTEEEIIAMIEQAQEAAKNRKPSPDEAKAGLDIARTQEIMAGLTGETPKGNLDNVKSTEIMANLMGVSSERKLEEEAQRKNKATNY
jgi:hypothetical protein